MLLNLNITNMTLWKQSIKCANCSCVRSLTAESKMFHDEIHEAYYASHDEGTAETLACEYYIELRAKNASGDEYTVEDFLCEYTDEEMIMME